MRLKDRVVVIEMWRGMGLNLGPDYRLGRAAVCCGLSFLMNEFDALGAVERSGCGD